MGNTFRKESILKNRTAGKHANCFKAQNSRQLVSLSLKFKPSFHLISDISLFFKKGRDTMLAEYAPEQQEALLTTISLLKTHYLGKHLSAQLALNTGSITGAVSFILC